MNRLIIYYGQTKKWIAKLPYICENPVRKGLVDFVDDYPWFWREWVEGMGAGRGRLCYRKGLSRRDVGWE